MKVKLSEFPNPIVGTLPALISKSDHDVFHWIPFRIGRRHAPWHLSWNRTEEKFTLTYDGRTYTIGEKLVQRDFARNEALVAVPQKPSAMKVVLFPKGGRYIWHGESQNLGDKIHSIEATVENLQVKITVSDDSSDETYVLPLFLDVKFEDPMISVSFTLPTHAFRVKVRGTTFNLSLETKDLPAKVIRLDAGDGGPLLSRDEQELFDEFCHHNMGQCQKGGRRGWWLWEILRDFVISMWRKIAYILAKSIKVGHFLGRGVVSSVAFLLGTVVHVISGVFGGLSGFIKFLLDRNVMEGPAYFD